MFDTHSFNLFAAGCGTGKTWYIGNKLLRDFPHLKPQEVLFVTSRAMIVDQQIKNTSISKYNPKDIAIVKYWNGAADTLDEVKHSGIQVMTYDKLIDILISKNTEDLETLNRVKFVVLDECHTLFSDLFIENFAAVKIWIKEKVDEGNKIFLGLTATPNIIYYYQRGWGVKVNQLNKEPLLRYSAKQLVCTNYETIPYLITTNKLPGKTLIMCVSIGDCYDLQSKIPNSAVLVSRSNKKAYMPEMGDIRDYIVLNNSLPDEFMYVSKRNDDLSPTEYEFRKLNVLITTSTLREGVNLDEKSGVRNIITCFGDELHVGQFMGRCRYNIDTLVVADRFNPSDNRYADAYIAQQRNLFRSYMADQQVVRWFDTISHLVDHDIYDIKRIVLGKNEAGFIDWINRRWLLPIGADSETIEKHKIYKERDKEEIIREAIHYHLYQIRRDRYTFSKIIKTMEKDFGYEILDGRISVGGARYTYKLILSYSEEQKREKGCTTHGA